MLGGGAPVRLVSINSSVHARKFLCSLCDFSPECFILSAVSSAGELTDFLAQVSGGRRQHKPQACLRVPLEDLLQGTGEGEPSAPVETQEGR